MKDPDPDAYRRNLLEARDLITRAVDEPDRGRRIALLGSIQARLNGARVVADAHYRD